MGIKYIEGDLFDSIKNSLDSIVIPHIANNLGRWGAGFVVPLGRTFPSSKSEYLKWHKDGTNFKLGEIQKVVISNICVVNMVAQNGLVSSSNVRPVRYPALGKCMESVREFIKTSFNGAIHCPMFGSGLGGADWLFIEQMIEDAWISAGIPVNVYYLPDKYPSNWTPPK